MKHQVSERSRNRAAELCKQLFGPTGEPKGMSKLGKWLNDPNAHPYFIENWDDPQAKKDLARFYER